MAEIIFNDLSLEENDETIKVSLLKYFYFDIDKKDIEKIGKYKIEKKKITIDASQEKADRKIDFLIAKNITKLKSKLTKKPAVYVHKNSGIPLVGSVSFGIVDRNSSLIEVKPITGCNLNCIYCSIDEGPNSKRGTDFIVDKDYLVEEFKKIVEYKNVDGIEAHIGPNGEPSMYAPLVELIRDLKKIKQVKTISMDTNGILLTKEKIDELATAGLTRFNLSLNAIDSDVAKKIAGSGTESGTGGGAGSGYDVESIKKRGIYMAKKADVMITPVWLPGFNDDEIGKLIEFAKEIGAGKTSPAIGIQNFLNYRFGRNPTKQMEWDEFFDKLKVLEKKHDIKLTVDSKNYQIKETRVLEKPFKKGDIIKAVIVCNGRMKNEKIGVYKNRTISIPNCFSKSKEIKIKITKSKHNIFIGAPLKSN